MKITCPQCNKQYKVDPTKIPPNKETSKCRSCGFDIPLAPYRQPPKECLKCGYQRKPEDDARATPEECPNCKAIYSKVEAAIEAQKQAEEEAEEALRLAEEEAGLESEEEGVKQSEAHHNKQSSPPRHSNNLTREFDNVKKSGSMPHFVIMRILATLYLIAGIMGSMTWVLMTGSGERGGFIGVIIGLGCLVLTILLSSFVFVFVSVAEAIVDIRYILLNK